MGALCLFAASCKRKHIPTTDDPNLPYPACEGAPYEVVVRGHLRSGPNSFEKDVVEHFTYEQNPCFFRVTVHQEWPRQIADVEAIYDRTWKPLRAWKRMTIPHAPREDGFADIRRYELRVPGVHIKRRDASGLFTNEWLRSGGRIPMKAGDGVGALVGPGRGLLGAWILRAKLSVGEKSHEPTLDFREGIEKFEVAMLRRDSDRDEPGLGRVSVYALFGREGVFVNDAQGVVGDLSGLRTHEALSTSAPEPLPTYGIPNPETTP